MENIQLNISYWIYPEGEDFKGIEEFKIELSNDYKTDITSERTDAMGGGLYEIVVELISDVNFADIAESYIEDGIKLGLGYFWKPIFKKIKELFQKNKELSPDIEVAKFKFKDIEIIVYPLFQNSIDESIDNIIRGILRNYLSIKREIKNEIKSIHVPIFNHIDSYEICAFRVKLDVDENITSFQKDDYFRLWGIRCNKKIDYVYNLKSGTALKTKFYTQLEYDKLFDKKFKVKR